MDRIVAITFDKIQAFLYNAILAQTQEQQTNSGTLRSVMTSSEEISNQFYHKVGVIGKEGHFSNSINQILLKCSGVCIFSTHLSSEEIRKRCQKLFAHYYLAFEGKLQLKYVSFEADLKDDLDKLETIRKGKSLLKGKDCQSRMLEDNQDLIFQLRTGTPRKTAEKKPEQTAFVQVINDLNPEGKTDKDTFRVAIIKADLDGMGNLFKGITDYATYQTISGLLSQYICLDSLERNVIKQQEKSSNFRLYPLYVAGDDILFAVAIKDLRDGINLCIQLVQILNEEIQKKISNEEIKPVSLLSISIGVEIVGNHEPIRYYHQRAEGQLEEAKHAPQVKELKDTVYTRICLNNTVFFNIEKASLDKKEKDSLNRKQVIQQWSHFLSTVEIIQQLQKEDFKIHHYLYGLIRKLDSELTKDEIACSNTVLYHLLPKHLESNNCSLRENELRLIEQLLGQVKKWTNGSWELCFGKKQCIRLQNYIKILLLFIDERFEISVTTSVKCNSNMDQQEKKRIRSLVFNKTLRLLFEKNLCESLSFGQNEMGKDTIEKLREIFIIPKQYTNKSKIEVGVYSTLPISPSMFHRFKRIKATFHDATEMLGLMENREQSEYKKISDERKSQSMAPPKLYYSQSAGTKLIQNVDKYELWSDTYIDSLFVFYQFNQALISYRTLYPKHKKED